MRRESFFILALGFTIGVAIADAILDVPVEPTKAQVVFEFPPELEPVPDVLPMPDVLPEPDPPVEALELFEPDPKPTLLVSSSHACAPCRALKTAYEKGLLSDFEVEFTYDEPFEGQTVYPAIRFKSDTSETGWRVLYGYGPDTINTLKAFTGVK